MNFSFLLLVHSDMQRSKASSNSKVVLVVCEKGLRCCNSAMQYWSYVGMSPNGSCCGTVWSPHFVWLHSDDAGVLHVIAERKPEGHRRYFVGSDGVGKLQHSVLCAYTIWDLTRICYRQNSKQPTWKLNSSIWLSFSEESGEGRTTRAIQAIAPFSYCWSSSP